MSRIGSWAGRALIVLVIATGCTSTRTSNTSRTGLEQLLISNAVDQALLRADFPALAGRRIFVDQSYLDCVDKGYLIGSLRQKLFAGGAKLVDKKEDSEITIEVRSGGVGTDNVESYLGMPQFAVPAPMPIEIPEVRLWERTAQYGTAKIGILAYATTSGELLFDTGRPVARADDSRWSLLGIGPFRSGSVREEVRQAMDKPKEVRVAEDPREDPY